MLDNINSSQCLFHDFSMYKDGFYWCYFHKITHSFSTLRLYIPIATLTDVTTIHLKYMINTVYWPV